MKRHIWNKFVKTRERYREAVDEINRKLPDLKNILQKLVDNRQNSKAAAYSVETPVVYNSSLDDISINDEIRLILVADNPGRREQAAENRRYLIGPSGKIAEKFFRDNPEFDIDFRKNVIILNKTPIHTPRTIELRELCRMGNKTDALAIAEVLEESQRTMAELLLEFQLCFAAEANAETGESIPVWITGYSEMKKNGIFHVYTETLKNLYKQAGEKMSSKLLLLRHFSMNQFTIDLKQQARPDETAGETLYRIGSAYRQRILGL